MDEIRAGDRMLLRPQDVAEVLGCHRYVVNIMAKNETLPFPYFMSGNRVKIPRDGFVAWMEGRDANKNATL